MWPNDPAFPTAEERAEEIPIRAASYGLTKREHIAALAMVGILSGDHPICHEDYCDQKVASEAAAMADALIEHLNKTAPVLCPICADNAKKYAHQTPVGAAS